MYACMHVCMYVCVCVHVRMYGYTINKVPCITVVVLSFQQTAAVVPIPSPKEKPPVTTTMADYADVRDCVSFSCTPAQNGEPSTPTLTVTDTVGYGEILHSAPKLQRVRNSSNANKLVDDSRHQSRAFSVTAMRDAMPQMQSTAMASTTPDISTCPEVPPPIPLRGLNMDQDPEAGDSSLPRGQAAGGTPQADSMDANGCLATETTAETAQ